MGRRHVPRILGSRKIRTNVLVNLNSVQSPQEHRTQISKLITVHSVVAVKLNNTRNVISERRKLPTIVSDCILKNHRVYIEREKSSVGRSNEEPSCEERPVNDQITEDGNISDASTVLYEDRLSAASSPELIVGV